MGFFPDLETLHIYLFASYDRSPKSGLMNFGGVYLSIDCLMFIASPPDDGFTEIVYHVALAHYSIEPNVIFYFHIYYLYILPILLGYCWLYHVTSKFSKKTKKKRLVIPIFSWGHIFYRFSCAQIVGHIMIIMWGSPNFINHSQVVMGRNPDTLSWYP